MKNVLILAGALAFGSTMASAGGMAVAVDPVVSAPVVISDWTGAYAGVSYGRAVALDTVTGAVGTLNAPGVFAGYRHDFGKLVVGGEVEYQKPSGSTGGTMLKAMAGYDMGRFLPYALVATEPNGPISYVAYGLGADFKVQENWTVGLEYLYAEPKFLGVKYKADTDRKSVV